MNDRSIIGLISCALALGSPAVVGAAGAVDWVITGSVATDYVQRGVSQTRGDEVVQGAVSASHRSGLWAGVFASNVDFIDHAFGFDDGADIEVDYSLGFGRPVAGLGSLGATVTWYRYPGSRSFIDYNYRELRVEADVHGVVTGAVTYSDDYSGYYKGGFAANGRAIYYELAAQRRIVGGFAWNAALGKADLERVVGVRYRYWRLGLSYQTGRFLFDAGWYGSDGNGRGVYGDSVAGNRLVFGVSATWP